MVAQSQVEGKTTTLTLSPGILQLPLYTENMLW